MLRAKPVGIKEGSEGITAELNAAAASSSNVIQEGGEEPIDEAADLFAALPPGSGKFGRERSKAGQVGLQDGARQRAAS